VYANITSLSAIYALYGCAASPYLQNMTARNQNYWMDEVEAERLDLLEAANDGLSRRHLDSIGLGAGWRCLDVGAGAGSVARYMLTKAGDSGYVVAADINPRFLEDFEGPSHTILAHDITRGAVPPCDFDLVHCRALLTHIADTERAIEAMVGSLRPGGRFACEEPDYVSMQACDPAHPHAEVLTVFRAIMTDNGKSDGYVGHKIHETLRNKGLREVKAAGTSHIAIGGSPWAEFRAKSLECSRPMLLASGFFDDAAVDLMIKMFQDPTFAYVEATWMSTSGRLP